MSTVWAWVAEHAVVLWLVGYVLMAATVTWQAWPVRHLRWLTLCFLLNALLFLFLPRTYLIAALADIAMVLLCVRFWCFASRRVARLALLAALINFGMLGWYLEVITNPALRDSFMVAYNSYPLVIRCIEFSQLAILAYWTPGAQRLRQWLNTSAERKGSSPWHLLQTHP